MCSYYLIVLEGLDCSGKTTICRKLACRLPQPKQISFPDRSSRAGQIINNFLKKDDKELTPVDPAELHLLYSADRYSKANFIRETLHTSHVVCDRYWYSGTAYSVAKGLDYNWCKGVDEHLPKPDFVFFLDVGPDVVSKRKGFGNEEHESSEFQQKVYKAYQQLMKDEKMIVIDGTKSVDAIVEDIISRITPIEQGKEHARNG
ncbi:dTMP kinase [Pancytospora epiphaga]|nr:dTMP kinase [Pancytospora epiphaga]